VLLAVWELASRSGIIPERTLAAPSAVLATLWSLLVSGELPQNLLVSFWRVGLGLAIGVTLGTVLALVAACRGRAKRRSIRSCRSSGPSPPWR
jgi:sulfonate transport system permease protein